MSEQAPIAECRLDLAGLRAQRERYRQLAGSVRALERRPGELRVRFAAGVDEQLLERTLAVEGGCCPFFRLDYVPAERQLRVGVSDPAQDAALDALRFALEADTAAPGR